MEGCWNWGLAAVSKWLPPGSLRGSALVRRDASSLVVPAVYISSPPRFSKLRVRLRKRKLDKKNQQHNNDDTSRPHRRRRPVLVVFSRAASKRHPCPCISAQLVTCDTKLRDQCKGTTCNRYTSHWSQKEDKRQENGVPSHSFCSCL